MKKAVIKRRKRVPAASAPAGRMSDQAAAEALVSVGRGMQSTEDEDAEGEDDMSPGGSMGDAGAAAAGGAPKLKLMLGKRG